MIRYLVDSRMNSTERLTFDGIFEHRMKIEGAFEDIWIASSTAELVVEMSIMSG